MDDESSTPSAEGLPRWRSVLRLFLDTYSSWLQDRTIRLGAGLAYYSLFALVPIVALTVAAAATLFDNREIELYLAEQLADATGVESDDVAAAITSEIDRRSVGSSMGLVGFAGLLFASSLMFVALEDAVNSIWHVPVEPGLAESFRRRMVAFILVGATGGLIIVSFILSAAAGAIESAARSDLPAVSDAADLAASALGGLVLVGAIGSLFRYVGPRQIRWRTALTAALPTGVLLTVSTWLTGWYFQRWGSPSVPGAFGALIVVLTWIYFEAQILLAGVQLAKTMTISRDERCQHQISSAELTPGDRSSNDADQG
ncbi:MAG: YihY/virulence factor BrkB family protein [Acidimicrobiales bacterium]